MDSQTIQNNEVIKNKTPKNFHGKKGRSGRPPGSTNYRKALKEKVIQNAWDVLEEFFNDPKIKKEKKAEIASRIATRDMQAPLIDQSTKNYIQIYRPEPYSAEEIESVSKETNRNV